MSRTVQPPKIQDVPGHPDIPGRVALHCTVAVSLCCWCNLWYSLPQSHRLMIIIPLAYMLVILEMAPLKLRARPRLGLHELTQRYTWTPRHFTGAVGLIAFCVIPLPKDVTKPRKWSPVNLKCTVTCSVWRSENMPFHRQISGTPQRDVQIRHCFRLRLHCTPVFNTFNTHWATSESHKGTRIRLHFYHRS